MENSFKEVRNAKPTHSIVLMLEKTLDVLLAALSFLTAYYLKKNFLPASLAGLSSEPNYYIVLMLIAVSWYLACNWVGMYVSYRKAVFLEFVYKTLKANIVCLLILTVLMYLSHIQGVSRLLIFLFVLINFFLVVLCKFVIYTMLKRMRGSEQHQKNILIVGTRERAVDLINAIEGFPDSGYRIIGCLSIEHERIGDVISGNHKVVGCLHDLHKILSENVVDELVFAMRILKSMKAERFIEQAERMGVTVRIMPDWQVQNLMYQPGVANIRIAEFAGLYTMTFQSTPLNEGKLLLKATFDYFLGATLLLLFLPVFLIVAVIIKYSSKGPVFYNQERVGLNGRKFMIYKFRTMIFNADEVKQELLDLNEADGPVFKIENDPRIIPGIGTFLRRSGMDELPQLINILKGEMSFVGPRPPIPSEVLKYSVWQRRRLSMKPGLTCYWQIAPNRNRLSFDDWMKLDLQYIDTWSLYNDLKIMLLTLRSVITFSGR